MTKEKALPFESSLMFYKKLDQSYMKLCCDSVKEYELSSCQVAIILFLVNNHPLDTAKDITTYRGISKALVCKNVDSLINRGLLESFVDEKDKRYIHLRLSLSSREIVSRLTSTRDKFFESLLSSITEEELETMSIVKNKIRKNIDSLI